MRPQRLTHRPHEASQLLPVGVHLLLQDVVLRDLLLQLRHARPILALLDLLLQRSQQLSSTRGPGGSPPVPSLLPCQQQPSWSFEQRVDRPGVVPVNSWQLILGDMPFSSGPS